MCQHWAVGVGFVGGVQAEGSGVSGASGLLGKPGTFQRSPGRWDTRHAYQKLKSLRIWPTIFWEWPNFVLKKHRT